MPRGRPPRPLPDVKSFTVTIALTDYQELLKLVDKDTVPLAALVRQAIS